MIDCLFWLDYSCLTYSNLLRFPFFMKLAHRLLFAVLFSFQRTIALSDLITLSRHISFVKQIFLCFFRAVYRLTDGGYYPIILFPFCQTIFSNFIGSFLSAQTCPFVNLSVDTLTKAKRLTHFYSVAPLLEKRFACFPTSGDGLRNGGFCFCNGQNRFSV